MTFKKHSILHKVEATVKQAKTLETAATITTECIENSQINKESKVKMLEDIVKIKSLKKFLIWFYNAILAYEDCRII